MCLCLLWSSCALCCEHNCSQRPSQNVVCCCYCCAFVVFTVLSRSVPVTRPSSAQVRLIDGLPVSWIKSAVTTAQARAPLWTHGSCFGEVAAFQWTWNRLQAALELPTSSSSKKLPICPSTPLHPLLPVSVSQLSKSGSAHEVTQTCIKMPVLLCRSTCVCVFNCAFVWVCVFFCGCAASACPSSVWPRLGTFCCRF